MIPRRIIIVPSAGDNIDVAAAVGVGKVEKRLRMGGKVLRVGWIVCSEENASGSERGGGFSGDLGARILGIDLEYRAVHLHASGGPRTSDPIADRLLAPKTRAGTHEPS